MKLLRGAVPAERSARLLSGAFETVDFRGNIRVVRYKIDQ
eukprot:COSAG02_NODE_8448_length_2568_cov_1.404212_4_plen_40_part_00